MASIPKLRPSARPADAGYFRIRTLGTLAFATLLLAAGLFLSELATPQGGHAVHTTPEFLTRELGKRDASASLVRAPSAGVGVAIHAGGYTLATPAGVVDLSSLVPAARPWTTYRNGASRRTSVGSETVVVTRDRAEQFETVVRRQGVKTWRWKLATEYTPSITRGYVGFVDAGKELVPIQIEPVQILDGHGKRVTPSGLACGLERRDGSWWLTLRLDDTKLPLPYSIDPASTYNTSATSTTWTGTGTATLTIPAAVQVNDLLVVQQTSDLNSTTYPTGPTDNNSGTWNSLTAVARTGVSQVDAWRFAIAGDGSKTVTLTPSSLALSTTVNVASLHVFRGLDAAQSIATAQTAASGANARTISCPAITPVSGASSTTPEHLMCLVSGAATPSTEYSAATGMSPWTYRFDDATAATPSNALFSTEVTANTAIGAVTSSNNLYGSNTQRLAVAMGFNTDATAPTVSNVDSSTANGSYGDGSSVSIQVNFDEPVTVTGSPLLALNTSPARNATYSSGSGTSSLTFTYTVSAGDNSSDLDYAATSSLSLNGGTIKDAAGNNATLTLPTVGGASSLGGQENIVVDTTAPTVSSVSSSTANGSYNAGSSISIQVSFSEAVTVTGTPTLALNSGGSASYSSGSGSSTLTFAYTVAGGENSSDLDYSATTSLALAGGTIKDAATNNATLTLPTVGGASSLGGQKNIVIDTTAPTVSSVRSSTANGSYNAGSSISIQVSFSEAVTVTGTPTLALNTGGSASYSSGSGSSTLTFAYTVGASDSSADLDYSATTSLALAGGTIKDAATNNATLTLPAVGGASSLGGQKNLVIDTTAPTASVTTPASDATPYNAATLPASIAGSSGDAGGSSPVSSG